MSERFQATVYGLVLSLGIGWTLYIGKSVIVPIVFSVLVVYVIVGLACMVLVFAEFDATRPIAILLVEQYYDFARSLADHYVVLSRGEVVAKGVGATMEQDNVRAHLAV